MSARVMLWTVVAAVALLAGSTVANAKTKVAVAGDSLATNSEVPWPAVLGKLLGDEYEVQTFGANGLSVLTNTYRSIWVRYEHAKAAEYRGDITILAFGANDAKPGNWARKREWVGLYKRLIGMYKGENRKIYIVLPPPPTSEAPYGIDKKILQEELIPTLKKIAEETGCTIIDTNTPLQGRDDTIGGDHLYPTLVGHEIIGKVVYMALTGKTVDLPAPPKPKSKEEVVAENAAKAVTAAHVKTMNVGDVAELTPEYVQNEKGDGPDGKGNTEDDTWQFWFELAHAIKSFHRLSLATKTMPADQRLNGIFDPKSRPGHQKKVTGPIGGSTPNPKDTEGWIFMTDWDGRNEGWWGDLKAKQVLAHPFVEKNSHCCVAVSFRVPADGAYDVTGTLTDLMVAKIPQLTGITWRVEVAKEWKGNESPAPDTIAAKGGPIGDGKGPDSAPFEAKSVQCKKGELIRLVIDPNNNWGTDMTKVELKIKRVQ
ncbi:MAG: GDSL-type esterase/lipase family protein [Planctomycetaceae bacterium]|nr:GDSL-type esterase/lipase family protein [Planctomycetaceae bacterium]